jgi:exonuclease I
MAAISLSKMNAVTVEARTRFDITIKKPLTYYFKIKNKMEVKEYIDLICPEHSRTSCSDENIFNGFYLEDDGETISQKYYPRCTRCALLELENGMIKLTDSNKTIIPEKLSL